MVEIYQKYERLLNAFRMMATLQDEGYEPVPQEEAHESGNFDDAWQDGYNAADADTAVMAREVLRDIGEPLVA